MMKNFIALLILASAIFVFAPAANAAENAVRPATLPTAEFSSSPAQIRVRYRTVTRRIGRKYYRYTYRVSRYRNGRVVTRLVSRTRIR